ncbi:hypothetical protein [Mycoplasmopsis meleagridis]|uniref:hypothetical protein n=1 Tax=Mycoplasmopsis meleagridis TaxID=29561 RepID=UPI00073DACC8|nr:hypothetical protein [Mycoplasmopsis meleagridis]KUH47213.1 hypothetical protein ASB56_02625 [Mycoplasmopsis meleagridis]
MIKKKNNLIYSSKENLKTSNLLFQYRKKLFLYKSRFSIEKILAIFKWNFDANRLNGFNIKLSQTKSWNYEIFINEILKIFNLSNKNDYEYELLFNFWSFYFYALMRYYFKMRWRLGFISVNSYNKNTINNNDIIKRRYYYKFVRLISKQDLYNTKIRTLFNKLPFLLSREQK